MNYVFPVLLVGFAVMMFIQLRAQKKRVDSVRTAQNNVVVGDEIMLTCGIHGTVVRVGESDLGVEIAPNTTITVEKVALHSLLDKSARTSALRPVEDTAGVDTQYVDMQHVDTQHHADGVDLDGRDRDRNI